MADVTLNHPGPGTHKFPADAGTAFFTGDPIKLFWASDKGGFMLCWGDTVPTDADTGYGEGCIWILTGASPSLYCNQGSGTSCDFDEVTIA